MSGACPEFGFTLNFTLRSASADDVGDAITEDLVALLEANGMSMGGGGSDRELAVVITRDATQTTDADRQLVVGWTEKWERDARFHVSDLIDVSAVDWS